MSCCLENNANLTQIIEQIGYSKLVIVSFSPIGMYWTTFSDKLVMSFHASSKMFKVWNMTPFSILLDATAFYAAFEQVNDQDEITFTHNEGKLIIEVGEDQTILCTCTDATALVLSLIHI